MLPLVLGVVTTVWFTIGGLKDLRQLFRSLNAASRNPLDDGADKIPSSERSEISTSAHVR